MSTPLTNGSRQEQFAVLEGRFDRLEESLEKLRDILSREVKDIRDRVDVRTQPNFGTLAAWAGIVLMIVGGIASPIISGIQRSVEKNEVDARRTTDMLDIKLQNEFRLSMETAKEGLKGLDAVSAGRHDEATRQIEREAARIVRIESWLDDRMKADLEELRQRRMKEPMK